MIIYIYIKSTLFGFIQTLLVYNYIYTYISTYLYLPVHIHINTRFLSLLQDVSHFTLPTPRLRARQSRCRACPLSTSPALHTCDHRSSSHEFMRYLVPPMDMGSLTWIWAKTLAPSDPENGWHMDVHPTQIDNKRF